MSENLFRPCTLIDAVASVRPIEAETRRVDGRSLFGADTLSKILFRTISFGSARFSDSRVAEAQGSALANSFLTFLLCFFPSRLLYFANASLSRD